jgi:hypothetical protein
MPGRIVRTEPQKVSFANATLKCRECEIFIGAGHTDSVPMVAPDGRGPLCHACWNSWQRRHRQSRFMPTRWSLSA